MSEQIQTPNGAAKNKPTWKEESKTVTSTGLPSKRRAFWLEYYSKYHKKLLTGRFTFQKLTVRQLAQVGVRQAELNGGMSGGIPGYAVMYNMWLAHFDFCIAKNEKGEAQAPDWWQPYEEEDSKILEAIYDQIIVFEDSFFESLEGQRESVEGAGKEEQSPEVAEKVVGSEVQAAANQ